MPPTHVSLEDNDGGEKIRIDEMLNVILARVDDDASASVNSSSRVVSAPRSEFFSAHAVYLNIYDMSRGCAHVFSPLLLGRRLSGVWHTGIEVFGREYFYGGGMYKIAPGRIAKTMGLTLHERRFLGVTALDQSVFENFLYEIKPLFNEKTYNLLSWNCNHFSDMLARFLVGGGISPEFLRIGEEVRNSFFGRCLADCLMSMQPMT